MDQPAVKLLISQCKNGDRMSFRKLVEFHQPFAYAVAFRIMCNEFESEDVVQEAFIRVWKHLDSFNPEKQFKTWLYKIVVNLCYDKIRSERHLKKTASLDNIILNDFVCSDIESSIINKDLAEIIILLTQQLTPKQKIIFTLAELEGLSFDEISEITGMTHEKVSSNLYCARQSIKQMLECIENKEKIHVR